MTALPPYSLKPDPAQRLDHLPTGDDGEGQLPHLNQGDEWLEIGGLILDVLVLKVEFDGLLEVLQRLLDTLPLARYVQFGTQGHEEVALLGDH